MINETPEGEWDNIRPYWKTQARAKSCSTCLHQMDLRENQCELDMRGDLYVYGCPKWELNNGIYEWGTTKNGTFF